MDACKRGVAGFVLQALATLLILLSATLVSAVQPTAAQIQQFNSMSEDQKRKLAEQYGINLQSGSHSGAASPAKKIEQVEVVRPLGGRDSSPQGASPETLESWQQLWLSQQMAEQKKDEGLKPFGYDLFAGEPTTFAPVSEIPIPAYYRVGPGDTVRIQLFGKESREYEVQVDRNGRLNLPELGPLGVTGLSYDDLKSLIQRTIKERYIGVESAVTLGELRSLRVFVLGEARTPGSYTVSALSTITQALYVSGGVLPTGSLRNVQLKRQGKTVANLDLYDLLLQGDTSNDLVLQPGDVVFIPPLGKTVGVDGEVLRPAIYELKQERTLESVLGLAGGLLPTAKLSAIQLTRVKPGIQQKIIDLDASKAGDRGFELLDGDELNIASVNDLSEGFIRVEGAAAKPGDYAWRKGMRITDIIGSLRRDLKSEADLSYALVVREINERRDIATLAVNLALAVSQPGSPADIRLEELDRLLIFSRTQKPTDEEELSAEAMLQIYRSGQLSQPSQKVLPVSGISRHSSRPEDRLGTSHKSEEEPDFTRRTLLEPLLEQLKQQAKPGRPAQFVTLEGQLRFPGEYPLPLNQSLENLLAAAGGLMDSAYTLNAEISRVRLDESGQVVTQIFDLPLLTSSGETNVFEFESRDHLSVKPIPDYALRMVVAINGEVRFPGEYTLARGETLSQLIKRAGGLTASAFPEGAIFRRERLAEVERQRLLEAEDRLSRELAAIRVTETSSQTAAAETEDVLMLEDLLQDVRDAKPLGRLVIDLPAVLASDERQDVVLQDGDELVIPPVNQAVSVIGEVQFPTSHLYQAQLDVDEYLSLSGGPNQQADIEKIYVVRADGSVWIPETSAWFYSQSNHVAPGDTIVVPLDIDRLDNLELFTSVSQIFYQIALGAAAVGSL